MNAVPPRGFFRAKSEPTRGTAFFTICKCAVRCALLSTSRIFPQPESPTAHFSQLRVIVALALCATIYSNAEIVGGLARSATQLRLDETTQWQTTLSLT